jgi:chaperonin GroES
MTIEPLGARVLIQPVEQETTTASGIVLPETAKEKPQTGIIKAVGTEEEMVTDLAVEDKVLFPKYAGNEIQIEGVKYIIMDEGDVLARLKE